MTHLVEQAISEYQRKKTAELNEAGKEALSAHGFTFGSDEELLKFVSENVFVATNKDIFGTHKSYFIKDGQKLNLILATSEIFEENSMKVNYKIYRP